MHRLQKWDVVSGDLIWLVKPGKADVRSVRSWIGSIWTKINLRNLVPWEGSEWGWAEKWNIWIDQWSLLYININGIIPRCLCCLSERRDSDRSPVSRVWVELKERESLSKRKKTRGRGRLSFCNTSWESREIIWNQIERIPILAMLSFWFKFDFKNILANENVEFGFNFHS